MLESAALRSAALHSAALHSAAPDSAALGSMPAWSARLELRRVIRTRGCRRSRAAWPRSWQLRLELSPLGLELLTLCVVTRLQGRDLSSMAGGVEPTLCFLRRRALQ
jgi:hypothetical protein